MGNGTSFKVYKSDERLIRLLTIGLELAVFILWIHILLVQIEIAKYGTNFYNDRYEIVFLTFENNIILFISSPLKIYDFFIYKWVYEKYLIAMDKEVPS